MGVIHQFAPARAARMASLLLNRHSPQEIADAIEILVDVLDMMGGDPEAEDNGDTEYNGDDRGDQAWIEWHTMRGASKRGTNILAGQEDDEDDDPAEDDDPNGQQDEDGVNTGNGRHYLHGFGAQGAGCPISDPDQDNDYSTIPGGGSDAA